MRLEQFYLSKWISFDILKKMNRSCCGHIFNHGIAQVLDQAPQGFFVFVGLILGVFSYRKRRIDLLDFAGCLCELTEI